MPNPNHTFEPHFTVKQLAKTWNLGEKFVRRIFLKEDGVVIFHDYKPGRRVYRTLIIPESVARRVYERYRRLA